MHENSHKWNIKLGIRRTLLNLQIICYIFLLNWYQDDVWNKNKNIICNFPLWPKEKWLFYLALSDSISSLWSAFRQQTWETDGGKLCYGDNITLYYFHLIQRNIIHRILSIKPINIATKKAKKGVYYNSWGAKVSAA